MKLIRYMQLFEIDKNEKYQHLPQLKRQRKYHVYWLKGSGQQILIKIESKC